MQQNPHDSTESLAASSASWSSDESQDPLRHSLNLPPQFQWPQLKRQGTNLSLSDEDLDNVGQPTVWDGSRTGLHHIVKPLCERICSTKGHDHTASDLQINNAEKELSFIITSERRITPWQPDCTTAETIGLVTASPSTLTTRSWSLGSTADEMNSTRKGKPQRSKHTRSSVKKTTTKRPRGKQPKRFVSHRPATSAAAASMYPLSNLGSIPRIEWDLRQEVEVREWETRGGRSLLKDLCETARLSELKAVGEAKWSAEATPEKEARAGLEAKSV